MVFDTDVLIWVLRGYRKAADVIDAAEQRAASLVTYMELLQGARGKAEIRAIKGLLADLGFQMLPLTENIGHRASIYMEEYGLSGGLGMPDALIAATAVEANQELQTANVRHYRPIRELRIKQFRP
jgi:hypothetical protein